MNKKLLLAGLCISFALSPALVAEASDNAEVTATSTEVPENMPIDKIPEDAMNKVFVVKEINEEGTSAVLYQEDNEKIEYVLDLNQFRDDDVKVNNRYKIYWNGVAFTSFPAKFGHIYRVEKLDPVESDKPENMPVDKLPEDAVNETFVVKEINEEGTSAVLYQEDNEKIEYVLDLNQFRDDDVKVNNRYKIYWNGVAFTSFPAKFGHIYRVEKLEPLDEDDEFENMPIDKLPEDHESMEFEILEISKDDENPMATLAEVGNTDNKYVIKLKMLLDKYAGVGDVYKIYWDGVSLKSYPAQFGKIYRVEKVKANHYDESEMKELAISMFDALVQNQAASILLEQSPKTIANIKPSLEKLMGETNGLMEEAYSVFLTDKEKEDGNKDTAIVKIIQYKYDKKLESMSDQELAKSIFQNMIMTNAGKMLLDKTPKTVKSIEKELKEKVESSEKLVEDAIKTLK